MAEECATKANSKESRLRKSNCELRALFAAFDKDGNGYIDADELRSTMRDVGLELSDQDVGEMMDVAGVAIKDRIYFEGL
jgi:calmodulin